MHTVVMLIYCCVCLNHVVNGYDSEPPTLARSWSETEQYQLTLGETAYLECSVILKGLSQFSGWYQDGHHFEHVIIDPSCNPMKEVSMLWLGRKVVVSHVL